jgi:aldehyde dehydrogenase (NAD+)
VFSRNQQAIDQVLGSLSFSGGAVNQTNIFLFIETVPYGGVGSSGIGDYYGKCGFDSLTHAKSILISPPEVAIDHLFPPYTIEKVQALVSSEYNPRPQPTKRDRDLFQLVHQRAA